VAEEQRKMVGKVWPGAVLPFGRVYGSLLLLIINLLTKQFLTTTKVIRNIPNSSSRSLHRRTLQLQQNKGCCKMESVVKRLFLCFNLGLKLCKNISGLLWQSGLLRCFQSRPSKVQVSGLLYVCGYEETYRPVLKLMIGKNISEPLFALLFNTTFL